MLVSQIHLFETERIEEISERLNDNINIAIQSVQCDTTEIRIKNIYKLIVL